LTLPKTGAADLNAAFAIEGRGYTERVRGVSVFTVAFEFRLYRLQLLSQNCMAIRSARL